MSPTRRLSRNLAAEPAKAAAPLGTLLTDPEVDLVLARLRVAGRRQSRRRLGTIALLSALLLVLLVMTVTQGSSVALPFGDAIEAAVGRGSGLAEFIVWRDLLPRALTAILAGAVLGSSGVVYQRLVGNVLATPDIIGVSAGAAAGGVIVLVGLGRSGAATQVGALLGASIAVVAIMLLATGRSAVVHRIVLVGIGLSACFASVTNYVLAGADEVGTQRAMRWLVGSLHGADWSDVRLLAATMLVAAVLLLLTAPGLETLRLGDDLAAGLGTRVQRTRFALLLGGAAMAAIATSVVGPVAFVALVAGPIAARLPGGGITASALVGALVLAGSDLLAQKGPGISPVPTGAITALVGAPVLVVLLLQRRASV